MSERLTRAKERAELARLNRQQAQDKMITKLIKEARNMPKAEYESLRAGNSRKRRQTVTQTKATDERIIASDRSKGAEIGRYLEENAGTWRALMRQFKVCVVGADGPKLLVNTGDEFADQAGKYFNSMWAKNSDQLDDTPFAEQIANALTAVKREGDILCIFDDFLEEDGRLRWIESTQLIDMDNKGWGKWAVDNDWTEEVDGETVPLLQSNGIIRNSRGIVVGYAFTSEHGKFKINPLKDEFTAIRRFDLIKNPDGSAKLIKAPWRVNQHRGEGDALAVSTQQQDIYEAIASELQSMKKVAQIAGWLKLSDSSDSALTNIMRVLAQSGKTETEINAIINGDGTTPGAVGRTYEELEGIAGGKFDYLMPGEEVEYHDPARPNVDMTQFVDWIQVATGAALGVGRARSTLKAETSYTAFRGEELMSWDTFRWDQKWLERRVLDFVAIKALRYGLSKRIITATPPEGWEYMLSWSMPQMREVDEEKTEKATQLKLKNGTFSFADVLGPDWESKMIELGKQLEVAKENNLPLSIFETVSGTVIEQTGNEENAI